MRHLQNLESCTKIQLSLCRALTKCAGALARCFTGKPDVPYTRKQRPRAPLHSGLRGRRCGERAMPCIGLHHAKTGRRFTPLRATRTVCEVSHKTAGPVVRQTRHRLNRSLLGTLGIWDKSGAGRGVKASAYHPWVTYGERSCK